MDLNDKIYVAGSSGFVGSRLILKLKELGYKNIITRSRKELNLLDLEEVSSFMMIETPDVVIDCAARVGGIQENMKNPFFFLYDNLTIQNNLLISSFKNIKKFIYIGTACMYPSIFTIPMREEYILTAPLEKTNEGYALAKLCGLKMCENINKQFNDFKCIVLSPNNLYGPNDNFDIETAHVIPSLIIRMHEAKINNMKSLSIWGDGTARRQFVYIDDFVDAIIWSINNLEKTETHLNVAFEDDISIKDLAYKIKKVVDYKGELIFDKNKPSGMKVKKLDPSKINKLGWKGKTLLDEGLIKTYEYYKQKII